MYLDELVSWASRSTLSPEYHGEQITEHRYQTRWRTHVSSLSRSLTVLPSFFFRRISRAISTTITITTNTAPTATPITHNGVESSVSGCDTGVEVGANNTQFTLVAKGTVKFLFWGATVVFPSCPYSEVPLIWVMLYFSTTLAVSVLGSTPVQGRTKKNTKTETTCQDSGCIERWSAMKTFSLWYNSCMVYCEVWCAQHRQICRAESPAVVNSFIWIWIPCKAHHVGSLDGDELK